QETDWARLKDDSRTNFELGAGMCSGPYEAVVLQNLALMQRTRSVLEIGVFTGTATLALALVPSVTEIVALDIEPYLKETVEPYWNRAGVLDKIDFRIAPALESLAALAKAKHEPFDLVFIDADKPSYKAYVQAVLEGDLLSADGVILAACRSPTRPKRLGALKLTALSHSIDVCCSFNTFVRQHPDLETVMLPIRDGITIVRRR
ncbi:S-adenosyl-L-methionine-dependent methyltransferase, partial [Rhodotorula sp. JG-1b]